MSIYGFNVQEYTTSGKPRAQVSSGLLRLCHTAPSSYGPVVLEQFLDHPVTGDTIDILFLGYGFGYDAHLITRGIQDANPGAVINATVVELSKTLLDHPLSAHNVHHDFNPTIVQGDAFSWLGFSQSKFDYIFVDIFQADDHVPEQFLSKQFAIMLKSAMRNVAYFHILRMDDLSTLVSNCPGTGIEFVGDGYYRGKLLR